MLNFHAGLLKEVDENFEYKYQPIVNTLSGITLGYDFIPVCKDGKEIREFWDRCFSKLTLVQLQMIFLNRALEFLKNDENTESCVFIEADCRLAKMPDLFSKETMEYIESIKPYLSRICIVLPQKDNKLEPSEVNALFGFFSNSGFKIAIDDFGSGSFNYRLMYELVPDFVKLDSFFVQDMDKHLRKKMYVSNICNITKVLGVMVIAKGIDTKELYYASKELSIPLIEGKIVRDETFNKSRLKERYKHIEKLNIKDKRNTLKNSLKEYVEFLDPVYENEDMLDVLEKFRKNKNTTFLPALDMSGYPLGIIKDKDLKDFVYSAYGTALLKNKSAVKNVRQFVSECGVVDVNSDIDSALEIFSMSQDGNGVIVIKDTKYKGFLTSSSLLNALNKKNIISALEQNPLTGLAGNNAIQKYLTTHFANVGTDIIICYFDFDNFKPFNDKYGFRYGDRAIKLFADILRADLEEKGYFIGHIGGDDFFASLSSSDKDFSFEEAYGHYKEVVDKFRKNAESFYDEEDISRGFVEMCDRDGKKRDFPLLSVSGAIIEVIAKDQVVINRNLDKIFGDLKKAAKKSSEKLAAASLLN